MVLGVTLQKHDHRRCIAPAPQARHDVRPPSHNGRGCGHAHAPAYAWAGPILAALLPLLAGVATNARADDSAYDLFIEGSPVDAGNVNPNTGAHRFSCNSTVTLTADPQPGYRFAYWLGDVSDPRAQRTTITLNEAKVVVAVFHPEPKKRVEDEIRPGGGGGASSMTVATATDLSAPGWSPAGGAQAHGASRTVPLLVPVVVTPEPSTIALLTLGVLAVTRRRR